MEIRIKINDIDKIQELCKFVSKKGFDVDIKRGRYCCSADSIMGLLSIGLNEGATAIIENATEEETQEFIDFVTLLGMSE